MAKSRKRLTQGSGPESAGRMTIGEHLDELRGCVVRSLVALVLVCLACIWPAKYLLAAIARPVVLVLQRQGLDDSFLATSPIEAIVMYIKVVVVAALIISAPYIIYQFWSFVAVGLYKKEKAWVYRLFPVSLGLFATGVVFMYMFVLLIALNFLVGFAGWIPLPKADPSGWERVILGIEKPEPTTQPTTASAPAVVFLPVDPAQPHEGQIWFNTKENKLKLRGADDTHTVHMRPEKKRGMVTPHFRIGEYLSFVLVMTIAFGLAFQMPLVVYFLVRSGIVPEQTFRKYRKVVILVIVFIAGMLAPPDLLSHIMLSGPMILLFEVGLLVASRQRRQGDKVTK